MAEIDIDYLKLITAHQSAIYGYIRSLAPGVDIEDVVQETNIILWEKAETFRKGTNFKAFAFRIAHLKTLEALRSERRRSWLVLDGDILERLAEIDDEGGGDGAAHAALRDCLAALPEEERTLVHARYTRRETIRQIADRDGRSEGSLQQRFFRIRNSLRECILRSLAREGGLA